MFLTEAAYKKKGVSGNRLFMQQWQQDIFEQKNSIYVLFFSWDVGICSRQLWLTEICCLEALWMISHVILPNKIQAL